MLHPVGPLPAAVYWRRRVLVLLLLVAVLGGGGWAGVALAARAGSRPVGAAATSSTGSDVATPALELVVPSLASVRIPGRSPIGPAARSAPAAMSAPVPAAPCTDDMLSLQVRTPGKVPVGSKATFDLVVTNSSSVPCARALDKGLQELVMVDAAGTRVWGSDDCHPGQSSDTRTLVPGEAVTFPVVWDGLTSEPACTAPRATPRPGAYVVRGRLDTKTSADAPLTLVT